MLTVNARIELSCGCLRSPRAIPLSQVPAITQETECLTHGTVYVVHTATVST